MGWDPAPPAYDHPVQLSSTDDLERSRVTVFFRLVLAIAAFVVGGVLTGGSGSGGRSNYGGSAGVLWVSAFLGWFASLAKGRMPRQLRDANLYGLRYGAQTGGYILLLTDRYPDAD